MVNGAVLYLGSLYHRRHRPVNHEFTYPAITLAVDIEQLPKIRIFGFGHNRFSLFSIWDKDYLSTELKLSLKEKITQLLSKIDRPDLIQKAQKIVLVTSPRFLNLGFNPVSFFYCYSMDHQLEFVIAEVNNTFGETHFYLIETPLFGTGANHHYRVSKEFHVSPFFDRTGYYEFSFNQLDAHLSIEILLKREGDIFLTTSLSGRAVPFASRQIITSGLRWALSIVMTFPRILIQGTILHIKHRLPVISKPIPNHPNSVRKVVPFWSISNMIPWLKNTVIHHFSRLHGGHLDMVLPNGESQKLGDVTKPCHPIYVHDDRFFARSAIFGEIGFGESFMLGEWDTPDLTELLQFIYENLDVLEGNYSLARRFFSHFNNFKHHARQNTLKKSPKNIQDHYDLSNDLFELFLDPTMSYSSAIFEPANLSLEDAQRLKIRRIIEKADLNASHHLLEIGCGWGSLSIEAVKQTGCKVTALTLSQEQYDYFAKRIKDENLEGRITLKLQDYRQISGSFDRIISVEMIEAVGKKYLPLYFQSIDRLLSPSGIAVLQAITIRDHRYTTYSAEADWIQKHIFPGGHLPSLEEIQRLTDRYTRLQITHSEDIGPHYATTLAQWRNRFLAAKEVIYGLGFSEEFIRKWEFYFSYCEAGFQKKHVQNYQIVLSKPKAES